MSGVVSRWLGAVEQLPDIALRLARVQIENRPALQCVELYDSKDTLFYCDPPYIHDTRGDSKAYAYEMTNEQHEELADALNAVKGKVALSNYDCPLMDRLYPRSVGASCTLSAPTIAPRTFGTETLWLNYDPEDEKPDLRLKL